MDPNENIKQTAEALRAQDWERADELREALAQWLARGGFAPDWETSEASYVRSQLWKSHPNVGGTSHE